MENNPKQSRIALIIILVIAVIAIATTAVLLVNSNSSAPGTTQNETSNQAQTGDATITFTETGFSPSQLTVKKGTKITVINNSSHTLQFSSGEHPTHQENPEMNMGDLAPGEQGTVTLNHVGTHSFHDHHDDSKTGTLIVTE